MKTKKYILICVVILLIALAAGIAVSSRHHHVLPVLTGGTAPLQGLETLDLRGKAVSLRQYDAYRALLPDCEILWEVPFQGDRIPCGTTELTISSLTPGDLDAIAHLPGLRTVDAEQCRDYALLEALKAQNPACEVLYHVELNGNAWDLDTTSLAFTNADPDELIANLRYLPELTDVYFDQPGFSPEKLTELQRAYPQVTFTWEKDILGVTCTQDTTELDLSGTPLENVDLLESACAYLPKLEKLILCDCGLDNETLAAYRDRVREHYKVVWSVTIGILKVRTDETTFMPVKHNFSVHDSHMKDLFYCEDMRVVDVGHMGVKDLSWIYGMPHLEFLVLADTAVSDITPIGTLKELIYLELFKSPGIKDYSPIVNCTALQDLNVAYTNGDAAVFAEMTWLKHLWVNCTNISKEARALLSEKLTDTVIEFDHGWHMGNGWRDLDNYYVMRDLLEMPYYDWGSKRFLGKE